MIVGGANAAREALIQLEVRGPGGAQRTLDAAIDTGFNDELTLPRHVIAELGLAYGAPAQAALAGGQIVEMDYFRATIVWDGRARETLILEVAGTPLVGMGLLEGHRLTLDALPGGPVTIERLPV
jgi:clan AA aspartic protease